MSMPSYLTGNTITIPLLLFDGADNPYDAPNVAIEVRDPTGASRSATIVQDGTGSHYVDMLLDRPGIWYYKWTAGDAVKVAVDGTIYAKAPRPA